MNQHHILHTPIGGHVYIKRDERKDPPDIDLLAQAIINIVEHAQQSGTTKELEAAIQALDLPVAQNLVE